MTVRGFSATELRARVQETLEADRHYDVAVLGADRFRLARSYHPTWALILTVLAAPLIGLGLLFLLVKRTESCDVVVVDGPTSAVVTITGRLLPATLAQLKDSVERRTTQAEQYAPGTGPVAPGPKEHRPRRAAVPVGPPPGVARPPSPAAVQAPARAPASAPRRPATEPAIAAPIDRSNGHGDEHTRVPDDATRARPSQPSRPRASLRLNGTTVIDLHPARPVYLGRAPMGEGECVALGDDDLGVSKTHLCVWLEGSDVRLRDLHSTNGTSVVDAAGAEHPLPAGEVSVATIGSVVRFGAQTLEVLGR